jgi:hypothetical protein
MNDFTRIFIGYIAERSAYPTLVAKIDRDALKTSLESLPEPLNAEAVFIYCWQNLNAVTPVGDTDVAEVERMLANAQAAGSLAMGFVHARATAGDILAFQRAAVDTENDLKRQLRNARARATRAAKKAAAKP